ncbi:hypothetical protein [Fusobacterium sp.]|uniref:hypothetical protein n=1 Tax=Fusobacterium sp. TaxID=68766 RepID=UPI0025BF1AE2|nr:hypothetical protein [Fusobacterium sp.]
MANKSNYFPRRSSHFKNYEVILNGRGSHPEYTQIEIERAKDKNGKNYWVQFFIKEKVKKN